MRREWTENEINYMEKRYVSQPVEQTAKALNRSVYSVKRKASRLRLIHYANENLSAKTISRCFNSDVSVVIRWINKFELPAKSMSVGGQTKYSIDAEQFWKWAEKNKEIINWSKYEDKSLLPEPDWVKESKRNYANPKHRTRITEQDRTQVKMLLKKGYTYPMIAKEMGRTYDAISHIGRTVFYN